MGVIENLAILHRILPLLFIPDGVGVGLEIDRAACVLHVFEDVSNGAFVPAVLVLRSLMRCFSPLPLFVGGGVQHLFSHRSNHGSTTISNRQTLPLLDRDSNQPLHQTGTYRQALVNNLDCQCCQGVYTSRQQ